MFQLSSWITCDLCGKRVVSIGDEMGAIRDARGRKWRIVNFDRYGNQGHFCPRCAADKSNEELVDVVLARPD